MAQRKKDEPGVVWHVIAILMAIVMGVNDGLKGGVKPPPGDRRG